MSDDLIEETVKDKSTLNDLAEFTISETIGSGGCGTVVKAYWKRKGLTVALKSLYIGNNSVREFIKEHADGGNLRDYLAKNFKNLEWKDKIRIAREIAQGLTFLHDLKVVHRDLHPKNILVHQGTMMIADFGISKKDDISTWSTRAAQGIPAFIEPKYLADGTYKRNEKSDIYSYGVVLWEISSGRPPFENLMPFEMIIRIHQGLRETPVEDTLKDYEDLYKYCWDQEPSERPDIMKVFDKLEEIMEKLNVETETDDVDKLHEIDPDHNNFDAEDLTDEVSSNTSSSGTGITPIPPQSGTGITSIPPQSGTGTEILLVEFL
ncbi:8451_t:CDS:2 [Diversispora eburnea]|uniref:8451_t:CDS:1 n=1 Tax=Diversispora eburnea TaxID=1213867 RepID=A0A9N8ZWF0_9GLOM|nr:8451_t:CDS:2 [Diversispora eburnea]